MASGSGVTLLCSRFFPEHYGGVEERLWRLTTALTRNDVAVQVITENRIGAAQSETLAPNLTVRRIAPIDAGRWWRVAYAAHANEWRRVVNQYADHETVLATDPRMGAGALLASRRRRVVFHPAACTAAMNHIGRVRQDVFTMRLPRHLEWLDRLAYRAATRVVVSSGNIKRQFSGFYGTREGVAIIPYAAQIPPEIDRMSARARFGIDPNAFCVGFIGRLDPCKDLPFLFGALRQVRLDPADRLLIVGDGPDQSRLQALSTDLGNRIIWTGRLNPPDEALRAMDVLVLPSVYEAFGLVLLEAMSVGIPVAARADDGETVLTAANEIIAPDSGIVVGPNDGEALARALQRLKDEPGWRSALGAAARRRMLQRSWDDVAREFMDVFRDASGVSNRAQPAA